MHSVSDEHKASMDMTAMYGPNHFNRFIVVHIWQLTGIGMKEAVFQDLLERTLHECINKL